MPLILKRIFLVILLLSIQGFALSQNLRKINDKSVELYHHGKYQEVINQTSQVFLHIPDFDKKQYPLLISCLTTTALAQSSLGLHEDALQSLRTAFQLNNQFYVEPHYSHIERCNELAKEFTSLAMYDSADFYLGWAEQSFLEIKNKNSKHYEEQIYHLNNLFFQTNGLRATLLSDKGRTKEAIEVLTITLPWFKRLYPDTYTTLSNYQLTINNLATYYNEIGELDSARKYSLVYYQLTQNSKNMLDRIHAIQNLGSVERNASNLASAEGYWQEALSLIRKAKMENHYINMVILNNLGELYIETEEYEKAINSFKKSLILQKRRQAINPPLYQTTLSNLAVAQHWSGLYAIADSTFTELIDNLLKEIRHNFTYLNDEEKLSFYRQQIDFIENYKSFAFEAGNFLPLQEGDHPYVDENITSKLYNLQINTKAIILNASKRMRLAILKSDDKELIANYEIWQGSKNQLAKLLAEEGSNSDQINKLKSEIEQSEQWLANHSRSFQKGFTVEDISWKDIQQRLKPNEAAVELIKFFDGLVYGALILTPETKSRPIMSLILSTKSKHLERQYFQNYRNSIDFQLEDTISYKTYWQPIIDSIQHYMPSHVIPEKIYFSNEGIYNQINLNTLYNTAIKQYVLNETEVVLLTNTKELITRENSLTGSKKAALFGEPKFNLNDAPKNYKKLPGTGVEVKKIEHLLRNAHWESDIFLAERASETNLKTIDHPYLIHLATHGFFKPTKDKSSFIDAMMSSGLVMAGVENDLPDNDGLLTAYEMLNLDLDSTALVVLSACETAKGTEASGEGVYGLQRALKVSGAQHLMMSLWPIDDDATQELMVHFYSYWTEGNTMRQSLKLAQKELQKKYPSPYYWGAFILLGI